MPGFEEQLEGAKAGDERTVTITFPDDYGAENLAGKTAAFAVTVKEVKRKHLPELDDDFAADAAGFDTLEELREDVRGRLREADEQRVEAEFREAVLDAVARDARGGGPRRAGRGARARAVGAHAALALPPGHHARDVPADLRARTRTSCSTRRGPTPSGRCAARRSSQAVVEAEGIEPSDGDVLDALQATAARENTTPEKLRERLEKAGRLDDLREDLAQRRAVDLLAEAAVPITVEQAQARDKLWTPGRESAGAPADAGNPAPPARLWTPGQ